MLAGIVRDKQQCMWVFCESVPSWVGLSVRLCWRAFCKAVLAGAGISNGLSVRLCWRVLMWAFCKAVLAGAGRSTGLSVRLCWQGVLEETVGFL